MTACPISVAGIPTPTEPLDAVRSLAEAAARQRGTTLIGSDLQLFQDASAVAPTESPEQITPFGLGRTYELLLAPSARRKKGAHLTPELIARSLVAMAPPAHPGSRVLDPSVGGAAFLLAAADQLVAAGVGAAQVVDQLWGVDIDPGAIQVAEAAITIWALDHELEPRSLPQLTHGDGLLDDLPQVDLVVGNPPFLSQLRASSSHTAARRDALRARWGDLVGAYTDDAWLFLASGLRALAASGSLAMVQPVSILAARHGQAIRERILEHSDLVGMWIARDQVFDAAVQVCGIVLSRSQPDPERSVTRAVGSRFETVASWPAQPQANEWGPVAATAVGIPHVALADSRGTIADLATATAGFRDQFYGFVPFVSESSGDMSDDLAKLVTVGMIDVLGLSWGTREFKFAKQAYVRPVVDLAALRRDDQRLAAWVEARLRPKLLMATQTRVIEVWVDATGSCVPATPVLSIEPHTSDQDTLWKLAAALTAPAVSAYFLAAKFGTAMSLNAMKLAARDVLATPLPQDSGAWSAAAEILRSGTPDRIEFAQLMAAAYGVPDHELQLWWLDRITIPTDP